MQDTCATSQMVTRAKCTKSTIKSESRWAQECTGSQGGKYEEDFLKKERWHWGWALEDAQEFESFAGERRHCWPTKQQNQQPGEYEQSQETVGEKHYLMFN